VTETGERCVGFEGQLRHLLGLGVLLAGLAGASRLPGFFDGELLGFSTRAWVVAAVANAVAHQTYVCLCWRLELHGRHLTRVFGRAAFGIYAAGFAVLLLARPSLVTGLAIANAGSLPIDAGPARAISAVLLVPVLYLGYSVRRYFGFRRAMGIDHFDPSYRDAPLVREGIFRFTSNAMYSFAFLLLWVLACYFRSTAALCVALFSHLYIWVHYFCTERPDMKRIYGGESAT
jgi:hypothetical protein